MTCTTATARAAPATRTRSRRFTGRLGLVLRARPRVPVLPRARADRARRERPHQHRTRRLDPEDRRRSHWPVEPAGRASSTLGAETATAPFTRDVIEGSTNTVGAASRSDACSAAPRTRSCRGATGWRAITRTVIGADTTLTVTFSRSTGRRLAGADVVGPDYAPSVADPGTRRGLPDGRRPTRAARPSCGSTSPPTSTASVWCSASTPTSSGAADARCSARGGLELPAARRLERGRRQRPGHPGRRGVLDRHPQPGRGIGDLRWHDRAGASALAGAPERQPARSPRCPPIG